MSMEYEDRPDYDKYKSMILQAMHERNIRYRGPFDWEMDFDCDTITSAISNQLSMDVQSPRKGDHALMPPTGNQGRLENRKFNRNQLRILKLQHHEANTYTQGQHDCNDIRNNHHPDVPVKSTNFCGQMSARMVKSSNRYHKPYFKNNIHNAFNGVPRPSRRSQSWMSINDIPNQANMGGCIRLSPNLKHNDSNKSSSESDRFVDDRCNEGFNAYSDIAGNQSGGKITSNKPPKTPRSALAVDNLRQRYDSEAASLPNATFAIKAGPQTQISQWVVTLDDDPSDERPCVWVDIDHKYESFYKTKREDQSEEIDCAEIYCDNDSDFNNPKVSKQFNKYLRTDNAKSNSYDHPVGSLRRQICSIRDDFYRKLLHFRNAEDSYKCDDNTSKNNRYKHISDRLSSFRMHHKKRGMGPSSSRSSMALSGSLCSEMGSCENLHDKNNARCKNTMKTYSNISPSKHSFRLTDFSKIRALRSVSLNRRFGL
ncbi:hypothetical protein GJ496_002110 [Pomphorhynchus laevis]|nr:hypothetical protein GJ496_002110 [Pomphorhynchus laevis]